MAASLAKLCLAAALAQQVLGHDEYPLPFMPSVGVALYHGCVEHADNIHEEDAIEDVHGMSCDKLDADRLEDFGIDDCPALVSELSSLIMSFECVAETAQRQWVQNRCLLPNQGKQLYRCKNVLHKAIKKFEPEPIEGIDPEASEHMLDSFETILGIFNDCKNAVESDNPYLAHEIKSEIEAFCAEETDPKSMKAMGVTHDECKTALAVPLSAFFMATCSYYVLAQVTDPTLVKPEGIDIKVNDFVEHFAEIEQQLKDGTFNGLHHRLLQQDPLAKRLLRLYSLVGSEKHFGTSLGEALRKSASWSPASVALAAAASASALAALGLLAWRRHLAKSRPEDIEPILCAQDTKE